MNVKTILFTLKTTTSNPLDFEREDLGNEFVNKRYIRSKSWSSGHLCGLTLMRCFNSQLILLVVIFKSNVEIFLSPPGGIFISSPFEGEEGLI